MLVTLAGMRQQKVSPLCIACAFTFPPLFWTAVDRLNKQYP